MVSDEDDSNAPVLNPQVYLFKKNELNNLLSNRDVLCNQVNLD